jgi:prepilin-type N-terminal cleavage/methylation domain-containing protein
MPIARSHRRFPPGRIRPRGFTLTELMVTVTIMGVLVGMSAPHFGQALEQSRANFAVANLRAIWAAERLYWLENQTYTDKLTQTSPKGLYELGLLDPSIISTTGDYTYTVASAGSATFQAKATRSGSPSWTGEFTIDQTGATGGTLTAPGQSPITPGFQ